MEPTGNCGECGYRKGMSNPNKGVRIPGGYGKCISPDGLCEKYIPAGGTGQMPKHLSVREKKRLSELEGVIVRNFKAFYDVGCALREIQQQRLYRASHDTFADYSKELYDIATTTAYQYIEAADVVDNVRNCGQNNPNREGENVPQGGQNNPQIEILPANESQARALVKLPPEQQAEAWLKAVETAPNGRVTAAHVRRTIRDLGVASIKKVVKEAEETVTIKPDRQSAEFKAAFDAFYDQAAKERERNWRYTDQKVVLRSIEILHTLVRNFG